MMPTLDAVLCKWISRATTKLDDFNLPVGLVEDSIALLKRVLGADYLQHLLIEESEPVHFLDDEATLAQKTLANHQSIYSLKKQMVRLQSPRREEHGTAPPMGFPALVGVGVGSETRRL